MVSQQWCVTKSAVKHLNNNTLKVENLLYYYLGGPPGVPFWSPKKLPNVTYIGILVILEAQKAPKRYVYWHFGDYEGLKSSQTLRI